MPADILAQIARTVLYEGYLLWPYRRSAIKNQQRWTFGGIYPRAFAEASGGADRSTVRADVLIEVPDSGASIDVSLRFLQVVARQVHAIDATGARVPVSDLTIGGSRYLSWDEATERSATASCRAERDEQSHIPVDVPSGVEEELLPVPDGSGGGVIVRRWERLAATMTVSVGPVDTAARGTAVGAPPSESGLRRITVSVANDAPWQNAAPRDEVVRQTLVSAHIVLRTDCGAFLSTVDPGRGHQAVSSMLRNEGLWPTLVGDAGDRRTILASPIILGDYPRIAPESPGDLFDGGEIDQLLILNILTLTDEEQAEMRDSDPRGREILDRCRALSPNDLMRLHATVRAQRFAEPLVSSPFDAESTRERHLG